jgi:general secretion pathway protein G
MATHRLIQRSNGTTQQGFTLIEIMVVVVIIGLLATLVLPKVLNRQDQALVVKAKADIRAVASQLSLYKLDNFAYPTTAQGLEALVKNPGGKDARNWRGYLDKVPKDPWGSEYQYLSPGQRGEFDVWTNAADGVPGGTEMGADIGNWNLDEG